MDAGLLKATASEGISLVPIMANFFDSLSAASASDEVRAHAECFVKLSAVVELLRKSSRERSFLCLSRTNGLHSGNKLKKILV